MSIAGAAEERAGEDPGQTVPEPGPLVFIGGTGRSGTHALAQLLGRHSALADVPVEARFHCNKRGIPDLLEGRVTVRGFVDKLRGFWWHRVRVDGQPRGLYNLMREIDFERGVGDFERTFDHDPLRACRELFLALLGPVATRRGKPGLVEMSSHNVRESQTLLRMFPQARIVHALRDGRDSATSVRGKTWGPRSALAGVGWWADRIRAIEAGIRGNEDGADFSVPGDRFRVVLLEDLVGPDRERTYGGLLDFLELEDEEPIRKFFATRMTPQAAHLGRWRSELSLPSRALLQRRYARTVAALEREGNHAALALRSALQRERAGSSR